MNRLLQPINAFLYCETPDQWISAAIKPGNLPMLLQDHCTCELKAAQSAALLIRKYAIDPACGATLLSWLKPYEDFVYRKVGDGHFASAKNGLSGELQIRADVLPDRQSKRRQRGGDKISAAARQEIVDKMVRLIKEELHHFEQVLAIMTQRGLPYVSLSAARYAAGLLRHVSSHEPAALVDKLIIGAYIEARSCERFAKVAPLLDDQLQRFYVSLLRSESRHYQDYLRLAETIVQGDEKQRQGLADRIRYFGEIEAELIQSPDPEFRFHSGVPC